MQGNKKAVSQLSSSMRTMKFMQKSKPDNSGLEDGQKKEKEVKISSSTMSLKFMQNRSPSTTNNTVSSESDTKAQQTTQISAKAASILNKMNPDFWENTKLIEKLTNSSAAAQKPQNSILSKIIVDRESPMYYFDLGDEKPQENDPKTQNSGPKTFSESETAGKRVFNELNEDKTSKKGSKSQEKAEKPRNIVKEIIMNSSNDEGENKKRKRSDNNNKKDKKDEPEKKKHKKNS